MNKKLITLLATTLILGSCLFLNSCSKTTGNSTGTASTDASAATTGAQNTKYPSDAIPIFDHWNLILGDGSNVRCINPSFTSTS